MEVCNTVLQTGEQLISTKVYENIREEIEYK